MLYNTSLIPYSKVSQADIVVPVENQKQKEASMCPANLERPLTDEERKRIWAAVWKNMPPDDREPEEVINEKYGGDTDQYLRAMAKWHRIPLGGEPTPQP